MEFVGKLVKKEFKGFGSFTGVVQSYDQSSGFFEIFYEDGDSEELDFSEVSSLIGTTDLGGNAVNPVHVKPKLGRKPKKRRRVEKKGDILGAGSGNKIEETLEKKEDFEVSRIMIRNVDLNVEFKETLEKERFFVGGLRENNGSVNGNLVVDGEIKDGLDLNAGFNFKLNDGFNLNDEDLCLKKKERSCIDLNLDVNGEIEDNLEIVKTPKRECGFDLNLVVDDESKDDGDGDFVGKMKQSNSLHTMEVGIANKEIREVHVTREICLGLAATRSRSRKKGKVSVEKFKTCNGSNGLQLKEDFASPGSAVIDGSQGDMGNSIKQLSGGRKKRKVTDNLDSLSEAALRRSARRGSAKNDVSSSTALVSVDDLSSSSVVDLSMEELVEEPVVLPPKLQLPPSSQNLDLDGIPVFDVFSIYACLRAFSTLLFLSPFELEDFVSALKCKFPSSLFDCIHVSILRIMKKHLEHLSNEGSESASNCLRSLNWGLLDLITWPIFMVEYLLIHNSKLKPDFEFTGLKLFKSEYYKQPVSVKVEILRCLCDDMIEVEAIRLELNRRSSVVEPDMDADRNMSNEVGKKRRVAMDMSGGSCMTEEIVDDANDRNSDECCLCKMDGNLLCCDGCPAAYHSKCVGVANDLLPEGDWFCPECAIDRHKAWMKPHKSIRGADPLGVDPYGRLYYSSSGYLLVSDSCDTEISFNYYHRNDLDVVIDVLKSSDSFYGDIIKAINKQWDITVGLNGVRSILDSNTVRSSSEGSAEMTQMTSSILNPQKQGPKRAAKFSNQSEIPEKLPPLGISSVTSTSSDIKHKFSSPTHTSSAINTGKVNTSQVQCEIAYVNHYSFAQTASSIAEELIQKPSNGSNVKPIKTVEEVISIQTKAILKKSDKFYWPDVYNLNVDTQKEKCGWCFPCQVPTDGMDCLFNMTNARVCGSLEGEVAGLQSKRNKKGHLIDVICHILSMEDRLRGLLLGPWLNPHYTKLWRKSALKAADVATVKHLLLKLESNLHHRALSAEWLKHVDSVVTMGSASHIVITPSRASSKLGMGKKKAKCSDLDGNPSSDAPRGLCMCWWRGGRVSCQLFNWKVLPRSLSSKAARQAGCMKIPGILYPESSDFAKRSRNIAWKAAVESSTSVEQLAIQVREFDSNIKWDDVENTHPLCTMDKTFRKAARLFKKATIRRKCLKEEGMKYLVDFGKRRGVPDIVVRHGSRLDESSSGRKKYWLNESYVPLHLLKSFEERRISRKSSKLNSTKLSESSRVIKKSMREKGFSYLFSKAERSEYYQCGHCNKNVLIRDAVCCQYCEGFFHKRHAKKSAGAITAKFRYTCHRCQGGKFKKIESEVAKSDTKMTKSDTKYAKSDTKIVKSDTKKGKMNTRSAKVQSQKCKKETTGYKPVQLKNSKKSVVGRRPLRSQNEKKVPVVPLRRSARKVKFVSVQTKKPGRRKKVKPNSKNKISKKSKKGTPWQKERTPAYYSYWLNGLQLSRKPDDERVMEFRRNKIFDSSEHLTVIRDQPKCCLCREAGHRSTSNYISCDICGEWYHGDAYGLNIENISALIGFRCHACLTKTPPICPFRVPKGSDESQLVDAHKSIQIECSIQVCKSVLSSSEVKPGLQSHTNEELQGSSPVDECGQEKQLHSCMLESRLEAEQEHNTDPVYISNKDLTPDILTTSNKHVMLEENTVRAVDDVIVTPHDQAESPPFNVDVDSMDTKSASLCHDKENDGLMKSTAILKSPVDGTLDQVVSPSCKLDTDSMDTKSAPLCHDKEEDGFVKTKAILKSPVDETLDQVVSASCELNVDSVDSKSASLCHDEEKGGLVKTTAIPKSPVGDTFDQAESPSSKVDVDPMDIESVLSCDDKEKNGLVKTTTILNLQVREILDQAVSPSCKVDMDSMDTKSASR